MKKAMTAFCAVAFCLTLTACRTTGTVEIPTHPDAPSFSSTTATETSSAPQTEPENTLEESRTVQETAGTEAPVERETVAPTEPERTPSSVASEEETEPRPTLPPQTEPEPAPTEPPSEPDVIYAGAADTRAVADRVLEYINSFRASSAAKLPGLTSYAEYRSRQLISNFAHDTNDERAAATALQYGEYVDPSVFGGSGEPYYRANASEAIAKAGYVGTVDEVAYKLATLVRDSAEHWCYIGSAEYCYIAVGVTYESNMWYCDIAVTTENMDNL